jgi:hypothetical protein
MIRLGAVIRRILIGVKRFSYGTFLPSSRRQTVRGSSSR